MRYVIAPISVFDDYELLWETKVAIDLGGLPLAYTCWGMTEQDSRLSAKKLVDILESIVAESPFFEN